MSIGLGVLGGCSSDDAGEPPSTSQPPSIVVVAPDEFEARVEEPGVVVINVHTPNRGDIPGTDLRIPFDTITDSTELPDDLDTPLAIYCRSGSMSATAVDDLEAMGYTDIVELRGGYEAWVDAGLPFEGPST